MRKIITVVTCSALLMGSGFAFAADTTSASGDGMQQEPHKMDHMSKKPQEMKSSTWTQCKKAKRLNKMK